MRTKTMAAGLLFAACGQTPSTSEPVLPPTAAPVVHRVEVTLVTAPTNRSVARFVCPSLGDAVACGVLGAPPKRSELSVTFDVALSIENPNTSSLPISEGLVAFRAFPNLGAEDTVGVLCIAAAGAEGPCQFASDGLRSIDDYPDAAGGLLSQPTRTDASASLVARRLRPGEMATIHVPLVLRPASLVALLRRGAADALESVTTGSVPRIAIPFQLEGTLWSQSGETGRLSVGFGPVVGRWELE